MFSRFLLIVLLLNLWTDPISGERWDAIVYTGDKAYAATGSKIEIKIFGTEGNEGRTTLHGGFVRDTTDTTSLYASIGEPYKITVYSDGAGAASGWYLGWIKLKSSTTHKEYRFACYCWLDDESKDISGDTEVCRNIPHCRPGHKYCRRSIDDSRCTLCEDPYYSGGWRGGCKLCPSINKCTDRYCRSSTDVKCRSCQHNNVYNKVSTDGRRCDVCQVVNKCVDQYCSTGMSSTKCRSCEHNKVFYKVSPDMTRCEKMCAWNNHYCWPGTCGDDLVKNCQCASGFQLISTASETSCQLQSSPTIETCATRTIGPNGEIKMSKPTGPCQYKSDFYGNFHPVQQHFNIFASYQVDTRAFPKPAAVYINSNHFGITDITVRSVVSRIGASEQILQTVPLLSDNTLSNNAVDTFANERTLTVRRITLHSGDSKANLDKFKRLQKKLKHKT